VNMERSTEAYCLIVALCAYVMIQANMKVPSNMFSRPEVAQMSNMTLGHALLEESVRVRNGYDFRENPTHMTVLTSWFYSGSYFGLARENTAWGYLREATTHAQLLGMHDEETYKHDPLDISRKRVLYWVLFIAERYKNSQENHVQDPAKSAQLTQEQAICATQTSPNIPIPHNTPAIPGRSTFRSPYCSWFGTSHHFVQNDRRHIYRPLEPSSHARESCLARTTANTALGSSPGISGVYGSPRRRNPHHTAMAQGDGLAAMCLPRPCQQCHQR
jgi:hypothetical protein